MPLIYASLLAALRFSLLLAIVDAFALMIFTLRLRHAAAYVAVVLRFSLPPYADDAMPRHYAATPALPPLIRCRIRLLLRCRLPCRPCCRAMIRLLSAADTPLPPPLPCRCCRHEDTCTMATTHTTQPNNAAIIRHLMTSPLPLPPAAAATLPHYIFITLRRFRCHFFFFAFRDAAFRQPDAAADAATIFDAAMRDISPC